MSECKYPAYLAHTVHRRPRLRFRLQVADPVTGRESGFPDRWRGVRYKFTLQESESRVSHTIQTEVCTRGLVLAISEAGSSACVNDG